MAEYPWWFYLANCWRDLLPWSLALPLAAWYFVRHRLWRHDSLAAFGLLWLSAMTLLLSCMQFKHGLSPARVSRRGVVFWAASWKPPGSECNKPAAPARVRSIPFPPVYFLTVAACVLGWGVFITQFLPAEELRQPNQQFAEQVRLKTQGLVLFFRVKAHDVAFHVGPPVATILEWENLERWLDLARRFS